MAGSWDERGVKYPRCFRLDDATMAELDEIRYLLRLYGDGTEGRRFRGQLTRTSALEWAILEALRLLRERSAR